MGPRFLSVDSILTSSLVHKFLKARVISENGSYLCLVMSGIELMSDAAVFSKNFSMFRLAWWGTNAGLGVYSFGKMLSRPCI